ncbi:hypothetical protein EIN_181610 [Entamoeba invadens IP1]|uniref:hypothetical protein n=1 Tax=Entamoeba invadens IP1 TaxID=370355 RepID=UPI0002C3DCEA|nr:hypothetical protein EIN_181610 [Entamoeba invadens IP1]ELP93994.1 hypothetical protein EIN_181610 [Entamoeba invadens IP1]|eukprot:XP_004260765.1 hypothetical protein EIN_181610 [Entamoeba invadens IP1]
MVFSVVLLFTLFSCALSGKVNCINDFIAVDMDSEDVEIVERKECYDNTIVKDYDKKILGENLGIKCYIHKDFLLVNLTPNNLSRCGEYIQLTGPTQRSQLCMIAGYVVVKSKDISDELSKVVIGVDKKVISTLVSGINQITLSMTQVTMNELVFDLGVNPSLIVLDRTSSNVKIQFINHNRTPSIAVIKNNGVTTSYPKQEDDTFVIPQYKERVSLGLVSFDGEIIFFDDFNTQSDVEKVSNSRFSSAEIQKCRFFADPLVWSENKEGLKASFFTWRVLQINRDNSTTIYTHLDKTIEFESKDGLLSVIFNYPTEMLFAQDFKEARITVEIEDVEDWKFIQSDLFMNVNSKDFNPSLNYPVQNRINTEYNIGTDGKTVDIKIGFDKRNRLFANVLVFTQMMSVGKKMKLKSVFFERSTQYDLQNDCGLKRFDCNNVECTIDLNNTIEDGPVPFDDGCIPFCGTCRTGMICSTTGKCKPQVNNNNRDKAEGLKILLFLLPFLLYL